MASDEINSGQVDHGREILSQDCYEGSPYQDNSWEVVGEPPSGLDFIPMELSTVGEKGIYSDPMFADYGGISQERAEKRWHLPEDVAYVSPEQREIEAQQEAEEQIPVSEVEVIKAQAFEEGKTTGLEQAVAENVAKYESMEKRLQQAFLDLRKQFEENIASAQKNAVALALQISKKIIDEAVEINPEYILSIIEEAMELSGTAAIECVRLSPQDLEFLEVIGVDKALKGDNCSWEFKADETIKAGCVVDTSAGEIDYQLDQAWERIKEKVVRITK